jgi:hypothetical protein
MEEGEVLQHGVSSPVLKQVQFLAASKIEKILCEYFSQHACPDVSQTLEPDECLSTTQVAGFFCSVLKALKALKLT